MIVLLVNLLVILLVLGVVYWVGTILLAWVHAPAPLQQVFHVVFVVICVIVLIYFMLGLVGGSPGLALHRYTF